MRPALVMLALLLVAGPVGLALTRLPRPDIIRELDDRGVNLFRINLSHTLLDAVESTIEFVQQHSTTPICLDMEGAQVRCGVMTPGVVLTERQRIKLASIDAIGSADVLTLRPASIFGELRIGSIVNIDFDGVMLRVTRVGRSDAEAIVVVGGRVRSNKAVTIEPQPRLQAFTDHDLRD